MTNKMSLFLMGAITAIASMTFATPDPVGRNDRQQIVIACSKDAAPIGCGGETDPKKFMMCIHNYKIAHEGFKVSKGCQDANKALKDHDQGH